MIRLAFAIPLLALSSTAPAQLAPEPFASGFNANGMALAQNSSAIEQSRFYRESTPPRALGINAQGDKLATAGAAAPDDDSFGAQLILKNQEPPRFFSLSGVASLVYTSNVALTARDPRDDLFGVVGAGFAWTPRLSAEVEAHVGLSASLFRYLERPELDFQNVGAGFGLSWSPARARGVNFFGRYDFTELWGGDGDQILMDHVLTLGAQKTFTFGRAHGLTAGVAGSLGFSDPGDAQRDQAGGFISYSLQLARNLQTDLLYRPALHIYERGDRVDFNQVVTWNLRYRMTRQAELNAYLSYGANHSDRAVFDYRVFNAGGGVAVNIRF